MFERTKKLSPPDDFNFPFEPYEIQQSLMRSLYETIENKEIGVFESPTGTGKSLTLTCGALRWLVDHNDLMRTELNEKIRQLKEDILKEEQSIADSTDWISEQFHSMCKKQELNVLEKICGDLAKREENFEKLKKNERNRGILKRIQSRKKLPGKENHAPRSEPSEFSVDDEDEDDDDVVEQEATEEITDKDVKVFFCSRTHSQLSQIVHEIKKTAFGKFIRCVSLSSRKNLCINPAVKQLSSLSLMNEKCLDMQKAQSKSTAKDEDGRARKLLKVRKQTEKCPFKNQAGVETLRDVALTEILDIEDLVDAGESLKACPYYASRQSVDGAQVVLLPYQILLHRKTRKQTGICLKDSVVIVDEAHNLLDTINSIYSTEITHDILKSAHEQLTRYKEKYYNRLHTRTLQKIGQLIFIVKQLTNITSPSTIRDGSHQAMEISELMEKAHFSNIKLSELIDYCEQTHLAEKIHGLAKSEAKCPPATQTDKSRSSSNSLLESLKNKSKVGGVKKKSQNVEVAKLESRSSPPPPPAVRIFLSFLESLTECEKSGRVILYNNEKVTGVKFALMNSAKHFEDIMKECRSVIIAGGTMQPVDDLKNQLLYAHLDRVKFYVYGHVVPEGAVQAFALATGPNSKQFRFTAALRSNPIMMSELARTLENVSTVIPGGIVCFFGSYSYLEEVYNYLKQTKRVECLEKRKFIYCEPRSSTDTGSIDKFLSDYAASVASTDRSGAILFSVVGGKLSEGLNFSDDLGRCVIVVGLPYPNKTSPCLLEQINYLNSNFGENAGNVYYENVCMKAVNQSIGRSIRHINDYACVILLDERFCEERIQSKLPEWIKPYLSAPKSYGSMHGSLAKFFKNKNTLITK